MHKAYICTLERDIPWVDHSKICHFCSQAQYAAFWPSQLSAKLECLDLNRGITIPEDGWFICTNFQTEMATPERFLIFCEIPAEAFLAENELLLMSRSESEA